MSADEIRKLADILKVWREECGVHPVHIWDAHVKTESALLAYADMVERCEKELAKFDRLLVPCCGNCAHFCAGRNHDYACSRHEPDGSRVEILANRKYVGYILRGDAGKEGK